MSRQDHTGATCPGSSRSSRLARQTVLCLGLALLVAAPLSSFAASCTVPVINPKRTWTPSPGIDTLAFVNNAVSNDYKGYVVTLTDRYGRLVGKVEDGLARTACDPGGERAFNVSTETPWGSNSKIITAAAVIKAAQARGIDLNEPLVDYLPYRWRSVMHNRFLYGENGSGPVTLAMMLQHRGGFHHSKCNGRTVRQRLTDGDMGGCAADPPPPAIGVRKYMNASAGLFNWALAYMVEPQFMAASEILAQNHSDANYDAFIQDRTSTIYRQWVTDQVYAPIGVTGTCNMAEISGPSPTGNYIRWYNGPGDANGTLPPDENDECSAGAWIISSAEMAKFLYRLRHTNDIISRQNYALMEASQLESLGWHQQSDWAMNGVAYTHNGAWGETRGNTQALPGGFVLTFVTNSGASPDESGGQLLKYAFERARKRGLSKAVVAIHSTTY